MQDLLVSDKLERKRVGRIANGTFFDNLSSDWSPSRSLLSGGTTVADIYCGERTNIVTVLLFLKLTVVNLSPMSTRDVVASLSCQLPCRIANATRQYIASKDRAISMKTVSPPPPVTLDEIYAFFGQILTTRYIAFGGVVFLLYDWLLTLDEEVNAIWPAKLTTTKVVFLLNRYGNIISQSVMIMYFSGVLRVDAHSNCVFYIVIYGTGVFVMGALIHVLVIIRTWVVCGRRTWITVVLATAYGLYAVSCIGLIIFASLTAADTFLYNVDGVCISFTSPNLWYVWLASLALEYVSFGFTMTSISRHYSGMRPGFRGLRPVARKLFTSALVYISFSTVCHLFNIVMWVKYWKSPYNMLAVTFACCLMNIAGQRFVLDIHKINRNKVIILSTGPPHLSQVELPTILDGRP